MTGANHSQYLSIAVLCQLVNLSLPSQFLCYCFSSLLLNLTLSSVTPNAFFTSTVSISATASVLMSPCGCRASLLLLPPKVPFILLFSTLHSPQFSSLTIVAKVRFYWSLLFCFAAIFSVVHSHLHFSNCHAERGQTQVCSGNCCVLSSKENNSHMTGQSQMECLLFFFLFSAQHFLTNPID